MAIPNPIPSFVEGLKLLWAQDTGNTDLVTGGAYTQVGAPLAEISTPYGKALQGSGAGAMDFPTATGIAETGPANGAFCMLLLITDASAAAGPLFAGVYDSNYILDKLRSEISSGYVYARQRTATSNALPPGGSLVPFQDRVMAVVYSAGPAGATMQMRALDNPTVYTKTNTSAVSANSATAYRARLMGGGAGNKPSYAPPGVAMLSLGIWNRELTPAEMSILLDNPRLLYSLPDIQAPTLTGAITVTDISQTGYALAWPAGTDNEVVAGYEVSVDGGTTWQDNAKKTTCTVSGRTPGMADAVRVRAKDAAGNVSTPALATTVQLHHLGVLGSTVKLTTASGANGSGLMYPSVSLGDEAKRFLLGITRMPASGALVYDETGAFEYIGPPDSFDFTITIDGVLAQGPNPDSSATATMAFSAEADTTPPALTGAITEVNKTATLLALSCPAAADNIGVVAYEWSRDAGVTWTAGTSTHTFTGLSPETAYAVRVRAKDAAGNASTPPLALSVTTAAAQLVDTTPPVLTGAITVLASGLTSLSVSCPEATDNVAVVAYEWSPDAGATWVSGNTPTHIFNDLAPATSYPLRVRAKDAAGNVSTPALATTATTDQVPEVVPPLLSSATVSAIGQSTATASVTTSEAGGTLYWLASAAATVTDEQVLAGTPQDVLQEGVQTVQATGLAPSTGYHLYFLHRSAAGASSAQLRTAQFTTAAAPDTTAPTLTGASAANTGQTTASASVSTSEADGTLYHVFSPSSTLSAQQLLAGSSQSVAAAGVQTVSASGLVPGATYYAHFLHRDTAGNDSAVVASPAFTTQSAPPAASGTLTTTLFRNKKGAVWASETGITVHVYAASSGDKVLTRTGLATTAGGQLQLSDPLLVADTAYRMVIVMASGVDGVTRQVAA